MVTVLEVRKILRALNMRINASQYETLKELVAEDADEDAGGGCGFAEFLVLMKKLLDMNFAGINTAARESLVQAGVMPPAWSGHDKVLSSGEAALARSGGAPMAH